MIVDFSDLYNVLNSLGLADVRTNEDMIISSLMGERKRNREVQTILQNRIDSTRKKIMVLLNDIKVREEELGKLETELKASFRPINDLVNEVTVSNSSSDPLVVYRTLSRLCNAVIADISGKKIKIEQLKREIGSLKRDLDKTKLDLTDYEEALSEYTVKNSWRNRKPEYSLKSGGGCNSCGSCNNGCSGVPESI